jgi:deazaflavin-dependent oxidoreductase (nitroreductase family)
MTTDAQAWEEMLIADARANGGRPSQGPLKGHPILVLYTTGARTGQRRRSIVTASRDGDAYVIAGTNGGNRSAHPNWLANIHADPNVTIEFGTESMDATAEELAGEERDAAWASHVEQLPHFGKYPEQITDRVIPVVRITPKG